MLDKHAVIQCWGRNISGIIFGVLINNSLPRINGLNYKLTEYSQGDQTEREFCKMVEKNLHKYCLLFRLNNLFISPD